MPSLKSQGTQETQSYGFHQDIYTPPRPGAIYQVGVICITSNNA